MAQLLALLALFALVGFLVFFRPAVERLFGDAFWVGAFLAGDDRRRRPGPSAVRGAIPESRKAGSGQLSFELTSRGKQAD